MQTRQDRVALGTLSSGVVLAIFVLAGCDGVAIGPIGTAPPRVVPAPASGPCAGLDAEACFGNEECAGRYGPSSVSGNIATTDVAFLACVPIPAAERAQALDERARCEAAGNRWQRTPHREPGFCACAGGVVGSAPTECPP